MDENAQTLAEGKHLMAGVFFSTEENSVDWRGSKGGLESMKKRVVFLITLILVISVVVLTSCGKTEFGCTDNTEKSMTITAKNAEKDSFFLTGTLVVADGEKLEIKSELEKGGVSLGFISAAGMDDIEKIPDVDVDPRLTAEASGTEIQEYEIIPGEYLLKANVTERATGTIKIDVQPAGTAQ